MVRVSVAAPYPATRAGLATIVAIGPDTELAGEAASIEELVEQAETLAPDAVLLDPGDDESGWREAIWQLTDAQTLPPIIALLSSVSAVSEWLRMVGGGVLLRDATTEEIVTSLRSVALGLVVLDSRAAEQLVNLSALTPETPSASSIMPPLTTRELEVLNHIARGMPNKTIATELGISEHTVKFHVSSILEKLGASSRAEALARAAHAGMIAL